MAKRASGAFLTGVSLDRQQAIPLHRQLYDTVRAAILSRALPPDSRLPSTRILAQELSLSRSTVVEAFLQLSAEGYIECRPGSGTYVTRTLPEDLDVPIFRPSAPVAEIGAPSVSHRSQAQRTVTLPERNRIDENGLPRAFVLGVPALDAFPHDTWGRLVATHGRDLRLSLKDYQGPAGYAPLREALAFYLRTARGVNCTPEQVIIVNGSQQGVALAAHVLLNPGDAVWMEEPGYFGATGALLGAGARLVPVPVDEEGLNVEVGEALCPHARLAFVTPSHQMPLGVMMSLKRRLALLEWAGRRQSWIIEDDYDSEFRYVGRPLAALQGLDQEGRVIYIGTFSKVLYPSLRLGYLVAPPSLVRALLTARFFADSHSPLLEQVVLTEFIRAGHFTRNAILMPPALAVRDTKSQRAKRVQNCTI